MPLKIAQQQIDEGKALQYLKKHYQLFLLLLPATVYFIVNNYIPMAGFYLAFTDFKFPLGLFGSPFVGLENFKFIYESGLMLRLVRNTILYNLAFTVVGISSELVIAIFLSEMYSRFFKKISQQVILLPHFISFVIVGAIAYNYLNTDYGVVNTIIKGLGFEPISFYSNKKIWPFLIVVFREWKSIGYGSVIFLAALSGIDPMLYESADIDGATMLQKIRHITIPSVKGTIVILLLFSVGRIMRGQFELFQNLVGGIGPLYSTTDIIETFVYRQITTTFDLGLGSAMGLFKAIVGFVLIVTINTITKRVTRGEHSLF
jgi:putative aldouronate transport system permease protein